jgi:hypothetical protein
LDYRDILPFGNFFHPEDVLGFFSYPLVAADRSNAEDFKFVRLQENQKRLLITGTRPAGILVNDDFDFLS